MRFLTLLFIAITNLAIAQSTSSTTGMTPGYYVVVGVFRQSTNAGGFATQVRKDFPSASIVFNKENSFFYVFTARLDLRDDALRMLEQTRAHINFRDAWVKNILEPPTDFAAADVVAAESDGEQKDDEPVDDYFNEEIQQNDHVDLGNTEVFLSLFNAANDRVLAGDVHVIDTERAKLIRDVPGNDYLILPNPNSNTGMLTLIAEIAGYRKVQHELRFDEPFSDTEKPFIELMGTSILINFDMVPFAKGEIQTLYHVYFFNDAAIMMPESRFELNNLLAVMQDNPKMKIRLHGHTNGHYHGKIFTPEPDGNFFSLTGSIQTSGTANELAYARAEAIKNWLESQGIDGKRIKLKSWGGKKPLYDKHGPNAVKNVRVEVEKLED